MVDEVRGEIHVPLRVFGHGFVKVLCDMGEDVESDEVKGAERGALWVTHRGPGHFVDFLDRITLVDHRVERNKRAIGPHPVGDKIRTILRRDDALAKPLVEETED